MELAITLHEYNIRIKQLLSGAIPPTWITAEVSEIMLNRSGHCYLQLAQKSENGEQPIATAKATIWAYTFKTLKSYFEEVTGHSLSKGMNVMLLVEPVFHELYGFSLNVKNIEPSFTIGDIERKRREIIERLTKEGVINMNRELSFPYLPQRVAVISSTTAAGWGDFQNHLLHNEQGFKFQLKLFPAIMQGDATEASVLAAFDRIADEIDDFDLVVLIRGGGAQTDLGSFDSYNLANCVAQFPIPVVAGIGHDRDITIIDFVANTKVKTPTAAADMLINVLLLRATECVNLNARLSTIVRLRLQKEISKVERSSLSLVSMVKSRLMRESSLINVLQQKKHSGALMYLQRQSGKLREYQLLYSQHLKNYIATQNKSLEKFELFVKYADPQRILERGFSITRINGKSINSVSKLCVGDEVETILKDGVIYSKVDKLDYDR